MKNPLPTCKHAFTLVELLTVLAILVVLVALLFPVLGRMNEKATATEATNRLRQIYVAFQGYAADNNGDLPAAGGMPDVEGEDKSSWTVRLHPYVDGRPHTGGWSVPDEFSECFVCPVWQKTAHYKARPYDTGFAMNYRLARPEEPVSGQDTATPRRQVALSGGANKILVAPGTGWGVQFQKFSKSYLTQGFNGPKRYGNSNAKAPQAQQKGYGIYLFLDGHVKQLKPDELDPYFL